VRASIGLHNTPADLAYLFTALRAILDRKFSDTYALDLATGEYAPAGWQPDYSRYFDL